MSLEEQLLLVGMWFGFIILVAGVGLAPIAYFLFMFTVVVGGMYLVATELGIVDPLRF